MYILGCLSSPEYFSTSRNPKASLIWIAQCLSWTSALLRVSSLDNACCTLPNTETVVYVCSSQGEFSWTLVKNTSTGVLRHCIIL